MTQRLSDDLWSAVEDVYTAIVAHPFITGLTDGTLPTEAFHHFVVQDGHYLSAFARALAVCAAKAPSEADSMMLASHSAGTIKAMHAELLTALGSSADQAAAEPVTPTTRAYGSYLLATAYGGSFAEGLSAVLPCYWIYARLAGELLERSSPNPLYARWIAVYGDQGYQEVVTSVLGLADRVGAELSPTEVGAVREHFVTTSRYEWMFWDAAYRRETWPV